MTPELDDDTAAALDLLALDADGNASSKILRGLPPEPPAVRWDMGRDGLVEDGDYSTEPPNVRTIALMLDKYPTLDAAVERARELAAARGEKVHRVFRTARSYVAKVYKPLPKPSAKQDVGF